MEFVNQLPTRLMASTESTVPLNTRVFDWVAEASGLARGKLEDVLKGEEGVFTTGLQTRGACQKSSVLE